MRQFRFRAWVTLDPPAQGEPMREYASGTRRLMVHVRCLALPALDKYFPSLITRDDGQPLKPGQPATVTITVTGDEAPWFLAPGQEFSIWGGGRGHGVVSRRVFTNGGPS